MHFEQLARHLLEVAAPQRAENAAHELSTFAFFEAYFSNFIEGTEFTLQEAEEIVFDGVIPRQRPQDAHDILGTYRIVADPIQRARVPGSADELVKLLRDIMIQVENEVGMDGDSRDHSAAADAAYAGTVPKELMDYLQQHKETLIPEFRKAWEAAGFKTSGTWEEVFGPGAATEGIFMAWHYARYLDRVAGAGKAEYPLPMFVNAALYGVGRTAFPPSGGRPWDLVMDVWKAGAPRMDFLAPDAYGNFPEFCAKYSRPGNPLFIPESLNQSVGAARVLYAFGRHDAIGFSAMGAVERSNSPDTALIGSYDLIEQLAPLISQHQGDGTMSAVLLGPEDPPQKFPVGNYILTVSFAKPRVAPLTQATPIPPNTFAAGIFIAAGPDEYFVTGLGINITFAPNTPGLPLAGWPPWKKAVLWTAAGSPDECWPATAPMRGRALG